jgi:hypothetical protein
MKVTIDGNICRVEKEKGDPIFRNGEWGSGESRLLYHVKQILNKRGMDLIKKRMWKDGHMVSKDQLYLRSRNFRGKRITAIWNNFFQIRGANYNFNEYGVTELHIIDITK